MPSTIDVVVPTFNRWELTKACLQDLAAQTVEHRVIVSDDGSSDGTPARVREAFPDATVVESERNSGFATACNRGVAAGAGKFVVLLNNDVRPQRDFLERVVAPFAHDERVGAVAPLLVRSDEHTIDSVGLAADATYAGFPRLAGHPIAEAASGRPALAGPSGGAAGYRRAAWEEVGGLDEAIFFYLEDLDLALRLRASGWQAATAPDAVAVHLGSATAGTRSAAMRFHSGFSRAYLLRRYGVLRTRFGPRAATTEALVAVADLALSRDTAAARGRIAGWRAAAGLPHARPPREVVERRIGLVDSLRLRWHDVSRPGPDDAAEGERAEYEEGREGQHVDHDPGGQRPRGTDAERL
jgi:N-acetylglucosaminyl-diphospho-decaprenol L-rhamnosyltransferase